MTSNPITVASDLSVEDAARLMVEHNVGALLVISDDELIGIVTEGDLIMQDVRVEFPTYIHLLGGFILYPPSTARFEAELKKAVGANVEMVMTADPVTVDAGATVEDVATLMVDKDVSRIPVMDEGRLVGIVSKHDIVESLIGE